MSTFFISDIHFDHKNILHLCNRPFKDLDHMTETIIQNWQGIVTDNDTVFVVGDFAFQYQNVPKYLSRLPGNKILIAGNHDKCAKELWAHSPGKYVDFYLRAGFSAVLTHTMLTIANHQVMLSHFPYKGDPQERYHDKRLEDRGHYLIRGHQHNKAPFYNGARQFNVSVEVTNYKPVSIEVMEDIITSGTTEIIPTTPAINNENDFHSQFDDTSTISLQNVTSLNNPLQSGGREGEPD